MDELNKFNVYRIKAMEKKINELEKKLLIYETIQKKTNKKTC